MHDDLRGVWPAVWLIAVATVAGCKGPHDRNAASAVWTLSQGADGPQLSSDSVSTTLEDANGKPYDLTLSIVCRHGRPNLEFQSLVMKCYAYCPKGSAVAMSESFEASDDPQVRLARVDQRRTAETPPFDQDLLSNAPADVAISGNASVGESQDSDWHKAHDEGAGVIRFDYGSDQAGADYIGRVDQQARNFINRLVRWPWFRASQGGAGDVTFDTRDLKGKLPQFWASCPPQKL
jgi:hypothetical protein